MGLSRDPRREIAVAPLREAFLRSGLSKGEVARRMGYMRPNIDKLNRALGLRGDSNTRGVRLYGRQFTTYATAAKLCEIIDGDPFACGL